MIVENEIELTHQYKGFINSFDLFLASPFEKIENYPLKFYPIDIGRLKIPTSMRLGNRVEQFIFENLFQNKNIDSIETNIQIIEDKVTLGELDCILQENNSLIHIEIVYKFYLYDDNKELKKLEHWVGPNKKDSLIQKLEKLEKKQFPLLHHKEVRKYLQKKQYNYKNLYQKILFKAQLFTPYQKNIEILKPLNPQCVRGFYIHQSQLNELSEHSFYLPSKVNWISEPRDNVMWLNITSFLIEVEKYMKNFNSPLCWIKTKGGEMHSFFVVWW